MDVATEPDADSCLLDVSGYSLADLDTIDRGPLVAALRRILCGTGNDGSDIAAFQNFHDTPPPTARR